MGSPKGSPKGSAETDTPPTDDRPDEGYDIRIARDGTWYHEGAPIKRLELARLFSTVLRRDDAGDYWLVTPAERGRILVEDVPFIAVEMRREGHGRDAEVSFRTNFDDWVTAGPDHPIRVGIPRGEEGGEDAVPVPYVAVRGGLEARVSRAVYYEMVEHAVPAPAEDGGAEDGGASQQEEVIGLWSGGRFFILGETEPTAEATAPMMPAARATGGDMAGGDMAGGNASADR